MGWRGVTAPRAGAHLCWGRVCASLGCNIVAGGEGAQGCAVRACVIVMVSYFLIVNKSGLETAWGISGCSTLLFLLFSAFRS